MGARASIAQLHSAARLRCETTPLLGRLDGRRRMTQTGRMSYRRVLPIVVAFLITRLLVLALYAPEIVWGDQLQYIRIANSILDHGWLSYLNPGFVLEAGQYYPYFKSSPSLPDGQFNPIFWDPLYPLFLSVVYELAGPSNGAVRAVQLLLSLFTLLLGMDVVRRMFPDLPRAPEWFGWFFVAYLPFAGFVTKLFTKCAVIDPVFRQQCRHIRERDTVTCRKLFD